MKRFCALLVVLGAALPLVLARCPDSFFGVGGSCYYFPTSGPWLWNEAREECKKLGADLAILNTPQELGDLSSVLHRQFKDAADGPFYVGGHKNNGIWSWINGDRININSNVWVPDEPSDRPTDNYVLLLSGNDHGRRYFATTGGHVGRFLCET
ncbi:C-type lectin domain family 6 member A-like [Panulirus ornatus]|uniref:C-type lectin domain family 6 member A-like n=1 Tax=Panulirus ornatus TaxID=150431 RepID=UPI003A863A32